MTKPTHVVPMTELGEYISGLLEEAPRAIEELSQLTGYSYSAINIRVTAMVEAGKAHRLPLPGFAGRLYVYHAGPEPVPPAVAPTAPPAPPAVAADAPVPVSFRIYPPIHRRDTLVAALFGPAKPAGKLLGAGSVLGGEG